MVKEILIIALVILILVILSMYFFLIRPIELQAERLGKELLEIRLKLEQICLETREMMKFNPRFKLECIKISN